MIPCVVREKNSRFSGLRIWQKRPQEAPKASNKYLHMTLCPHATRSHLCSPSDVQQVIQCQSVLLIAVSAWPWGSLQKKNPTKNIDAWNPACNHVVPGKGMHSALSFFVVLKLTKKKTFKNSKALKSLYVYTSLFARV